MKKTNGRTAVLACSLVLSLTGPQAAVVAAAAKHTDSSNRFTDTKIETAGPVTRPVLTKQPQMKTSKPKK